jgi:hypothetical protein
MNSSACGPKAGLERISFWHGCIALGAWVWRGGLGALAMPCAVWTVCDCLAGAKAWGCTCVCAMYQAEKICLCTYVHLRRPALCIISVGVACIVVACLFKLEFKSTLLLGSSCTLHAHMHMHSRKTSHSQHKYRREKDRAKKGAGPAWALPPFPAPMAGLAGNKDALLKLPLEVLTDVFQQLNLCDLMCVAQTCKHFR